MSIPGVIGKVTSVRTLRRLLLVVGIAGAVGWYTKLRGKDEVTPTSGGWRVLDGPEFR